MRTILKNGRIIVLSMLLTILLSNLAFAQISLDPKVQTEVQSSSNSRMQINTLPSSVFIGQPERYFMITKTVMPKSDLYSVDDTLTVLVEIKPLNYRIHSSINNLLIYEIVDRELVITAKAKNCTKISSIEDLENYRRNLHKNNLHGSSRNYNLSWDETQNIARTRIDDIQGNDRLLYWYNITPKANGIFSAKTTLRSEIYPDIESTLLISVVEINTLFNVSLEIENPIVKTGEPINLAYYISYSGGSANKKIVSIKSDLPSGDYMYLTKNLNGTFDLPKYKILILQNSIIFLKPGIFSPPGIQINGFHYRFEDEITVISVFTYVTGRLLEILKVFSPWIIAAISILVALFREEIKIKLLKKF